MSTIYIIDLYECYALDGFVRNIGYTTNKELAERYLSDYAEDNDYYIHITESKSLD